MSSSHKQNMQNASARFPNIQNSNGSGNHGNTKFKRSKQMSSASSMSWNNNNQNQATSSKEAGKEQFGPRYKRENDNPRNKFPISQRQYNGKIENRISKSCSFKYFENLLGLNEEEFVIKISQNRQSLANLVDSINLTNNTYVLMIRLLKKIFDSRFPHSQQILLQTILKEQFVDNLQKYLYSLPLHDENEKLQNQFFWENTDAFWTSLIEVLRKALELLPSYTSNLFPKIVSAIKICIPSLEEHQKMKVSEEIKKDVNEVFDVLKEIELRYKESSIMKSTHSKIEKRIIFVKDEPPNDFRTISVYPNTNEIMNQCDFLRPNVIKGPYRDVDHYLDVQFRLLREDFVNPLRSGVSAILSDKNLRHENVCVYRRIQFLHQEQVNNLYCYRLKFNFNKNSCNFNYEHSKKFMFGTLLCFTHDNFVTLKFARVAKRDLKDLKIGELIVEFDTHQPDSILEYNYLMIECKIYYEPYFHVLTALQNISEDNFAMKAYIVNVQPIEVLPTYLNEASIYKIDKREFSIQDLISNSIDVYGFNDSQAKAFKAALTQEFAMIQGPPGTGKTYVGLQIAKTLLNNQKIWRSKAPILVVCFTNHALDQFLEGLLDTTHNIARVGGQSKSELLEEFNITKLRQRDSYGKTNSYKIEMKMMLSELSSIDDNLRNIDQCAGVIAFYYDASDNCLLDFKCIFLKKPNQKNFIEWLLEGYQEEFHKYERTKETPKTDMNEYFGNPGTNNSFPPEYVIHANQNSTAHCKDSDYIFSNKDYYPLQFAISLQGFRMEIDQLMENIAKMENDNKNNNVPLNDTDNERRTLRKLQAQFIYLERKLNEVRTAIKNKRVRSSTITTNPKSLSYEDRWALYTFWLNTYRNELLRRRFALKKKYQELYKLYKEIQDVEDTLLLRTKLIVGMTTTSAARLKSVLEGLGSPIVIVEEAAQILESHIITALTNHCKHLILIGDHKQLKPSSADYKIFKHYNLGISLFERMVNNGIQYHTLNVQHRMRPEISELICPLIYPNLKNHNSVLNRPQIAGIDSCVRFIHHTHLEDNCENDSKTNSHEVKFAVALARHLILNNYKSEQITILVTYLGQMYAMLEERDKHGIMKNVRIVVLDNYQGEESDIIILSLVRSNTIQKIGFLGIENRVCVAFTRAKSGLYIIGNMELLSSTSKLWADIKNTLVMRNNIGPNLILRCQIHPNITTSVSDAADFEAISEGGCNKICEVQLDCSHLCKSLCHVQNREHKDYKCLDICNKKLCDKDESHVCLKKCCMLCGPCTYIVPKKLDCGHEVSIVCHDNNCPVIVSTKLPCDHTVDKPCHVDTNNLTCPSPCEITVDPCGHSCVKTCHINDDPDHLQYKCMKPCSRPRLGCTMPTNDTKHMCTELCFKPCVPCEVVIKKPRTKCSHMFDVPCSIDADSIKCTKPCKRNLSCGHKCKQICEERCDPLPCLIKVMKKFPLCGHKVYIACSKTPDRSKCNKKCLLQLPCGHPCTQLCNQSCTSQCQVLVNCQVEGACGHVILRMKCHDLSSGLKKNDRKLLENCSEPCKVKLKCGHKCSGTCGECLQGRFHKTCSEKCGAVLICNHECRFPCRQACRPCVAKCTYQCVHSSCAKKCGDICTPCQEPCRKSCEHQKCSQVCSAICNVAPCTKPCSKLLKCGHDCIGFCGEPCPPKCLICDREELLELELLFGYENEKSRFVLLIDCKHVLESEGLEHWLKMGDNSSAIGVKACPKCKTPIQKTLRYSDYIKRAIADVNEVKIKILGSVETIEKNREKLMKKVVKLYDTFKQSCWGLYLQTLNERLQPVHKQRRQQFNMIQLKSIEAKLQVIQQIADIIISQDEMHYCLEYQQNILNVLKRDIDYISNQEIEDVQNELGRFLRAIQYERLKRSTLFKIISETENEPLIQNIELALNDIKPYSNDAKLKFLLNDLKNVLKSSQVLSDIERCSIVKAMGMTRGHWFKCPKGHYYAIGDCGGATQTSKCNECGELIGGRNHTLLATNRFAPEMDNALYPAYSEMANNMGNFINLRQ